MAFQLGATLRQARETRQLAFEEVAAATRIHPRHLAALEAERFDTLPGRAYARSFLHEYAHFLGLDPSAFVAEYDARFCDTRVAPQPLVRVHRRRAHHVGGGLVLGLVAIALAVAVVAWKFGGESHPSRVTAPAAPSAPAARAATAPRKAAVTTAPRLVAVTASGRCWLSVRAGSASGPVVYEGTLEPGQTKRFARRPLWVRFGAPWNVTVRLDGRRVALPRAAGPVNVLFTSTAQQA